MNISTLPLETLFNPMYAIIFFILLTHYGGVETLTADDSMGLSGSCVAGSTLVNYEHEGPIESRVRFLPEETCFFQDSGRNWVFTGYFHFLLEEMEEIKTNRSY